MVYNKLISMIPLWGALLIIFVLSCILFFIMDLIIKNIINDNNIDEIKECSCKEYDYVIIGLGAAGSVIANNLSNYFEMNNTDIKILGIERGEHQCKYPQSFEYTGIGKTVSTSTFYKDEKSSRQTYLNCRKITIKQGNVVGGLTGGNGAVCIGGDKSDFEKWPKGWNFSDLKSSYDHIIDDFQSETTDKNTLFETIKYVAVKCLGFTELNVKEDIDKGNLRGIGYERMYIDIDQNKRKSAAEVYLEPIIRYNENIDILTECEATKIEFTCKNNKQIVDYICVRNIKTKQCYEIKVKKRLILCAGAVESPRILLKSGIGSKNDVVGECIIENKHVGYHLKDQCTIPLIYKINQSPKLVSGPCKDDKILDFVSKTNNWKIFFNVLIGFGTALALMALQTFILLFAGFTGIHSIIFYYIVGVCFGAFLALNAVLISTFGILFGMFMYTILVFSWYDFLNAFIYNGLLGTFYIAYWIIADYWFSDRFADNSLAGLQLWYNIKRKNTDDSLSVQMYFMTGYYFGDFLPGLLIDFPMNWLGLKILLRWIIRFIVIFSLAKYWLFRKMATILVSCARPKSEGYVDLYNLDPGYLKKEQDLKDMIHGVKTARSIMFNKFMCNYFTQFELYPSTFYSGDKGIENMIEKTARSTYHLVGSCRMATSKDKGVVSHVNNTVFGTENLDVMDSSVFPDITSTSNSLTIMAMARLYSMRLISKEQMV